MSGRKARRDAGTDGPEQSDSGLWWKGQSPSYSSAAIRPHRSFQTFLAPAGFYAGYFIKPAVGEQRSHQQIGAANADVQPLRV